ncbi:MAG: hemolysin family protein [bacterium]|nr:hemolysin family protein [bacterium]
MYSQFLVLLGLVLLSGVFSGSETALVSVSKSKVDELVSKKVRNAKLLKKLKQDPHKLLITVLIGNNIVNIGASAYAAVVFTNYFGNSGVGIATGVMTFFILVFGEITPKSFAHQHSTGVSLFIAKPIYVLQLVLFPLVWFFNLIVKLTHRIIGGKKGYTVTEGELVAMLNIGADEGSINKQEKEFIENVLEFNDIEVEEIMTPRVAIEALDSEMTIQEAVDFVILHSHSRIPIYRDNIDNIVGIITIKELLKYFDQYSPKKKLLNLSLTMPLTVPLSKKIDNLFREFQRKHSHMAIVIDEHGGTAGLVTLEDLLEEIVGDIVDEFDVHENPIEIIDNKTIITTGTTLVEDINDFFRIKFGPNDHDTINTMLTEHLHRFPREGDVIVFPRAKVTVLKIKKHCVDSVKITKLKRKL